MKMWICRDCEGLTLFGTMPKKYYPDPDNDNDYWWISEIGKHLILDPSLFPEVTFENSPMEVELVIKKYDECN